MLGLLKARGQQRTDSTHILAVLRGLNRLELVGETMRRTLDVLSTVAPEWLRHHVRPEWVGRYVRRLDDHRLPKGKEARRAEAEQFEVQRRLRAGRGLTQQQLAAAGRR